MIVYLSFGSFLPLVFRAQGSSAWKRKPGG